MFIAKFCILNSRHGDIRSFNMCTIIFWIKEFWTESFLFIICRFEHTFVHTINSVTYVLKTILQLFCCGLKNTKKNVYQASIYE